MRLAPSRKAAISGRAPPSFAQCRVGRIGCSLFIGAAAAVFPFLSTKFITALMPLVLLGYMLGWMVSAVSAGWSINPLLIVLDCVGILLALWRCKEAI